MKNYFLAVVMMFCVGNGLLQGMQLGERFSTGTLPSIPAPDDPNIEAYFTKNKNLFLNAFPQIIRTLKNPTVPSQVKDINAQALFPVQESLRAILQESRSLTSDNRTWLTVLLQEIDTALTGFTKNNLTPPSDSESTADYLQRNQSRVQNGIMFHLHTLKESSSTPEEKQEAVKGLLRFKEALLVLLTAPDSEWALEYLLRINPVIQQYQDQQEAAASASSPSRQRKTLEEIDGMLQHMSTTSKKVTPDSWDQDRDRWDIITSDLISIMLDKSVEKATRISAFNALNDVVANVYLPSLQESSLPAATRVSIITLLHQALQALITNKCGNYAGQFGYLNVGPLGTIQTRAPQDSTLEEKLDQVTSLLLPKTPEEPFKQNLGGLQSGVDLLKEFPAWLGFVDRKRDLLRKPLALCHFILLHNGFDSTTKQQAQNLVSQIEEQLAALECYEDDLRDPRSKLNKDTDARAHLKAEEQALKEQMKEIRAQLELVRLNLGTLMPSLYQ